MLQSSTKCSIKVLCSPCRYISSPSVNIWLHLLHRAQLGW